MDLKTTRIVKWSLLGLLALCWLLMTVLESQTPVWLAVIAIVIAFAFLIIHLVFWRCPSCRRHLGRSGGEYCPHCGKHI